MGKRRAVPSHDRPALDPIFGSASNCGFEMRNFGLISRWWYASARVTVAITIAVCAARADSALPPATVSVMSPRGRIRAIWDATRVEDVKRHKVLWSILDSHFSLLVADDGKHLVERYDGLKSSPCRFQ